MARKLFEKGGFVRGIAFFCFVLCSLVGSTRAESVNPNSTDLQANQSLLASQCGYAIDKNLSAQILRSMSSVSDKVVSVYFYLKLTPVQRPIHGKLSFGCFSPQSEASQKNIPPKTTAKDEIALEDSGGRYARNIVWQRTYDGEGWAGTIAYVNSVSGDGKKRRSPDFFLICPNVDRLSCFSFEVEKLKLENAESDRIPELLRGVMLVNNNS